MSEIKVRLSVCRSGYILAEDIMNERGVILAGKNTVLNEYIISKLEKMGIRTAWLYKESCIQKKDLLEERDFERAKQNYKETVIGVKNIIKTLAVGKPLEYDELNHTVESLYGSISNMNYILAYLQELHTYDDYTSYHCTNVAFYAMLLSRWLNMTDKQIRDIIQAGLLHDIGKLNIPKDILNKKQKLTEEEYMIMKQHSSIGFEMIKSFKEIEDSIKEAVLMHHERMDGSGYPTGATGKYIGEYAKIIAIADVYDAMISERPYKKRSTPFDAFQMFSTTGTSAFDLSMVKIFLLNISSHLVGAHVRLDNGDVGEIVYCPPHEIGKPIIRVMSSYIDISKDCNPQIISVL